MSPSDSGSQDSSWTGQRRISWTASGLLSLLLLPLGLSLLLGAEYRLGQLDGAQDPVSLLLHIVGLVVCARAFVQLWRSAARIALWMKAPSIRLAIRDERISLDYSGQLLEIPKGSLVGAAEEGDWRTRPGGNRDTDIYLVHATGEEWYRAVPPVFGVSPGIITEQIMRWRGPQPVEPPGPPPPSPLPSEIYDEAQRATRSNDKIIIRQSYAWILDGPFIGLFFGAATLLQLRHASPEMIANLAEGSTAVFIIAIAALLLLIPGSWIAQTLRHLKPRAGISLILTRHRSLFRTRAGVQDIAWQDITRIGVDSTPGWSLLRGKHMRRKLVLTHKSLGSIQIEESQLSAPVEAIALAAECLRTGQMSL